MDNLKLTGLNQGRVFNSRNGCTNPMSVLRGIIKLSNLELKTRLKQLSGSLTLDFVKFYKFHYETLTAVTLPVS